MRSKRIVLTRCALLLVERVLVVSSLHFLGQLAESVGDEERGVDESVCAVGQASLVSAAQRTPHRADARLPTHVVHRVNLRHQFGFLCLHLYLHLEVSRSTGGHASAQSHVAAAAANGGGASVEAQVKLAAAGSPQLAGERRSVTTPASGR